MGFWLTPCCWVVTRVESTGVGQPTSLKLPGRRRVPWRQACLVWIAGRSRVPGRPAVPRATRVPGGPPGDQRLRSALGVVPRGQVGTRAGLRDGARGPDPAGAGRVAGHPGAVPGPRRHDGCPAPGSRVGSSMGASPPSASAGPSLRLHATLGCGPCVGTGRCWLKLERQQVDQRIRSSGPEHELDVNRQACVPS